MNGLEEHYCVHCGNVVSPTDEVLGEEFIRFHYKSPFKDVKGEFTSVSCYRCLTGAVGLEWKPKGLIRVTNCILEIFDLLC
ncbi:MAG: hypothetical protein ACFFCS_26725 [Candidatus Hodarchaeota archaeon]